ncbi:MAG: AAA family ATPase [Muribaculaceae bacterium]|nr:AAA family ATPase [Muribaculaceae bacterium]
MKLIRLEIQNLASLDRPEGETIDFTQGALGNSTIFSIVGPTGSGKSTLLDAICLALYGRAPRYPRKKGDRNQKVETYGIDDEKVHLVPNDCRNILTRGKKTGFSKLTFQTNDGSLYRAEWHVKFNNVKFDDKVKPVLYKLTILPDGTQAEEDADWTELPQIIGLEYEQFLRTVLIAQGAFSNFLNANEKERSQLLEKLVGNEELYTSIAEQIKAKATQANEAYRDISSSIDAIKQDLLDDAALHQIEEQIATLEQAENALTAKLKKVEDELRWYAEEKAMTDDVSTKQNIAVQAAAKQKAFDDDAHRLALHDALDEAIDLLREANRVQSELGKLRGDIDARKAKARQLNDDIEAKNKALEQMNKSAEDARKALDETTPHIRRARELMTKIDEAKTRLEERDEAKRKAEQEATEATQALEDNKSKIEHDKQAVADAQAQLQKSIEKLDQERMALTEQVQTIENAINGLQSQIEGKTADELGTSKSEADNVLQALKRAIEVVNSLADAKAEKLKAEAEQKNIMQQSEQARNEKSKLNIETLEKEVEEDKRLFTLITSEKWQSHRHSLKDGTPCPLCGATVHPYQADDRLLDDAINGLNTRLAAKQADLERQKKADRTHSDIIQRNEGLLQGIITRLQQVQADIEQHNDTWNALHAQHPTWPNDKDALEALKPSLEQNQQQADEALRHFNRIQAEINKQNKHKDDAVKARDKVVSESQDIISQLQQVVSDATQRLAVDEKLTDTLLPDQVKKQQALADATTKWQTASDTYNVLNEAFKQELGGELPDTVEQRLKKAVTDAEASLSSLNEEIVQLRNDMSQLTGAIEEQNKLLAEKEQHHKASKDELAQWLAAYNTRADRLCEVDLGVVTALLYATDNWESVRRQKEALAQEVASAQALLAESQRAHNLHQDSRPEQTHAQLLAQQAELQQNSQRDKLIDAKTTKKRHDDAVQKMGGKAEQLSLAQQQRDDWKEINDAIGSEGNTLRKVAQCYTLGFLIEHANAEIRKFNRRYELQQIKNSLAIRVIDHDRADDVRFTNSLSGGETFIVSLGLALGLSSLSSRNIRFDNLFIDEGFGTLDADTLATVINSLAMLQTSQGKKVGVISHTDTMSERITTQIRVIPNGSTGSSRIEIVP